MTLSANVQSLAIRVATEFKRHKTVTDSINSDLSALEAEVGALKDAPALGIDDDSVSGDSTWSSQRVSAALDAAINSLVDSAPAELDTLRELAEALAASDSAVDGLVAQVASVGDTSTDFVAAFEGAL